jgi:cell division protein ZapE
MIDRPPSATASTGVLAAYRALRAAGKLAPDPAQQLAAEKLQSLANALAGYRLSENSHGWQARFGLGRRRETPPQGLYIFGEAGRGKSMLMDLFFEHVAVERKRRVHFHAFMLEVHERRHDLDPRIPGDPIQPIAREMAQQAWLLCFDEFHVTDIADAMILGRLFQAMLELGVVVVATSNFAPDELYRNGLQRELFLPFIALIKEKLDVLQLDGGIDWRRRKLKDMRVYVTPLGPAATASLDGAFAALTEGATPKPETLVVQGRFLKVARAAGSVARFSFHELCEEPLGPADYVAIAQHFRTIVLDDIPVMGVDRRNPARRFITLIDELYEHRVKLVCSAASEPDRLCTASDVAELFKRASSRLIEMQTEEYLEQEHLM